jgi:tryptophanyl-tRNA synthetase
MSKSDPSAQASVLLMDDADTISKKFKRATTDSEGLPTEVEGLKGRAEADNLVGIYAALADKSKAEVLQEFGGKGFGAFKPALADLAVAVLGPVADRMRRLMADPGTIDAILRNGAGKAAALAEPIMDDVRRIVGFVR